MNCGAGIGVIGCGRSTRRPPRGLSVRLTKYAVTLTEAERARLRTLVGRGTAPARMLTRARILLKADQWEGGAAWADAAIAGALDIHPTTVARVRRQCVEEGLAAALERKRPDRVYEPALDGAAEARLVAVGMRRLGAALIELGAHVGAAPDAPAPPAPLADPDPVR